MSKSNWDVVVKFNTAFDGVNPFEIDFHFASEQIRLEFQDNYDNDGNDILFHNLTKVGTYPYYVKGVYNACYSINFILNKLFPQMKVGVCYTSNGEITEMNKK